MIVLKTRLQPHVSTKMDESSILRDCMNESSLMKGKFSLLVKQINEQKVQLEDKEKSAVSALITSWNKGEKTTLDYFDMKDHHHYLNHWCMQDYNGTVPTDIRELYKEYIQIGLKMRVKLLKLNVMLKAKSS